MSYKLAAVDVHKRMLAVVIADVEKEGDFEFQHRKFDATARRIAVDWAEPVLAALAAEAGGATKMSGKLHLCQAKSNRGPRRRKNDFGDGEAG